jgi:heat shock protein HslJ
MRLLTLVFPLFLLLTVGCAAEREPAAVMPDAAQGEPADPFRSEVPVGSWRLIGFGDATEPGEIDVTLRVEADGKMSGTSGCNRYSGAWTPGEGGARVGPFAATKMACPPPRMEIEDRYLEELGSVRGWRRHVEGIVLVDAAGDPRLVFEPFTPSE